MVMYPPPRSSSAGIRRIRRELQCRRSKPLAPTKSVAKKPSASPPPPRHGSSDAVRDPRHHPPHREILSSSTSHSRGSTVVTDASPQFGRPRASSRCIAASPPPRLPVPSSAGSASRATPDVAAAVLRPGTMVGVRTRTTTLKTGQVLVLWLKATVVSSTSHGGYEVVYDDGSRPSGDPKGTFCVARHHVRVIKTSPPPPTTPPPSLPPPTATAQKKEMLPAARPTTAGKSVRLIRSLLPEMERHTRPALSGIGY